MASIGDHVDFDKPRLEGFYGEETEAQQSGNWSQDTTPTLKYAEDVRATVAR